MIEPATGELRELQMVEAQMLHDFKIICEKHNLRYFLDFGNLLGAVRHGGFIPWDDDIDVTMPYADYVKFLEIAQEELGEKYFLQTEDTDKNYYRSYARIRKNQTTYMDTYQLKWDIHHGVWMDIFPLVPINTGVELKFKKAIVRMSNFVLMDNFFDIHTDEFSQKLGKVFVWFVKTFHKIPRAKRAKFKKWMQRCVFNTKKKKPYIASIWTSITEIYPADIYETTTKLMYEGEEYTVPAQYERKLEIKYGDYMQLPPEEERKSHHGGDIIQDLNNNYTKYTKSESAPT